MVVRVEIEYLVNIVVRRLLVMVSKNRSYTILGRRLLKLERYV